MATWEVQLEVFTPTPGSIPSDGSDSLGIYTAWELNDQVSFTLTVPSGYTAGSELVLKFHEATASASKKHKWSADVSLNGGSAETFAENYTAGTIANTLTQRTLTISSAGEIDSVAIQADDLVAVTLSRVAAISDEDSNDIRLYALLVTATIADATFTDCVGRIGAIISKVMRLANDTRGDFRSWGDTFGAQVLDWVNDCTDEIASRGFWTKTTAIDIVVDQADYELMTLIPDFVDFDISVNTTSDYAIRRVDVSDLIAVQRRYLTLGTTDSIPWVYCLRGTLLTIAPTPASGITGGIEITHSYLPDHCGCVENFNPPIPSVWDSKIYVPWCLAFLALKDSGGKVAAQKYKQFMGQAQLGIADLLTAGFGPGLSVQPMR